MYESHHARFLDNLIYLYGSVVVVNGGEVTPHATSLIERAVSSWPISLGPQQRAEVMVRTINNVRRDVEVYGSILYGTPRFVEACVALSRALSPVGRGVLIRDLGFLARGDGHVSMAESAFIRALERVWKTGAAVPEPGPAQARFDLEDGNRKIDTGAAVEPSEFGALDRTLPAPQRWWWEHLRDLRDATVQKGGNVTPTSRTGRHMQLWKEMNEWVSQMSAVALSGDTVKWLNNPNQYQIGKLSYTYWARLSPESGDEMADGLHVGLQLSKRIKWVDEMAPSLSKYAEQPILTLWASTNDRGLARFANDAEIRERYGQVQLDMLLLHPELWSHGGALVRGPGKKGSRLQPAKEYLDAREQGTLSDASAARVSLFSPFVSLDHVIADPSGVSRLVVDYIRLLAEPVREARALISAEPRGTVPTVQSLLKTATAMSSRAASVPKELAALAEQLENAGFAEVSMRELLGWFGAQRRGNQVVERVRSALKVMGLDAAQFEGAGLDDVLRFGATPQRDITVVSEEIAADDESAYAVAVESNSIETEGEEEEPTKLVIKDDVKSTFTNHVVREDYSALPKHSVAAGDEQSKSNRDAGAVLTRAIVEANLAGTRADDFNVFTALESAAATAIAEGYIGVSLDGVTDIPDATLSTLATLSGGDLSLGGLTTLSDSAAAILATHQGTLWLNGLTNLSASVEKSLARHRGNIMLNGLRSLSSAMLAKRHVERTVDLQLDALTNISQEAMQVLVQGMDSLALTGLTTLSAEMAKVIASHRASVDLSGLTALSDAAAEMLGDQSDWLSLDGLKELSDSAAAAIARHEGALFLNGLTSLSDAAAAALARHKGMLGLDGITSISDVAAGALAGHDGPLNLGGLTTLSTAAAAALAKHADYLVLDGLENPDDAVIEELGKKCGGLTLRSVATLPDSAVQRLAQHEQYLALGLTHLSRTAEKALSEHEGGLSLSALVSLTSPALAATLAKGDYGTIEMDGLTSLSAPVALQFARFSGDWLSLNRLENLSVEVATALAGSRAASLSLDGLTSLSAGAAAALARYRGSLSLAGLTSLADDVAAQLARHAGSELILEGLSTLSAAAEASLAQHHGRVRLGDRSLGVVSEGGRNDKSDSDDAEDEETEPAPLTGDMLLDFLRAVGIWPEDRDPWGWDDEEELPAGSEQATAALVKHILEAPNWYELPADTDMSAGLNDPDVCREVSADEFSDLTGLDDYPWHKRGPLWYSSRMSINESVHGPVLFMRDGWIALDPDDHEQFVLNSWDDYLHCQWPATYREGQEVLEVPEVLLLGDRNAPPKIMLRHEQGCPWSRYSLSVAAAVLARLLPVAAESVSSGAMQRPHIMPWTKDLLRGIKRGEGSGATATTVGNKQRPTASSSFFAAVKKGDLDAVTSLLQAERIDLDQTEDLRRFTVLHYAAWDGRVEILEVLLAHGADANARDHDGYTPMNLAAACGHLGCVKALLDHGANTENRVAIKNVYHGTKGGTALRDAVLNQYWGIVDLLLARGADRSVLLEPCSGAPKVPTGFFDAVRQAGASEPSLRKRFDARRLGILESSCVNEANAAAEQGVKKGATNGSKKGAKERDEELGSRPRPTEGAVITGPRLPKPWIASFCEGSAQLKHAGARGIKAIQDRYRGGSASSKLPNRTLSRAACDALCARVRRERIIPVYLPKEVEEHCEPFHKWNKVMWFIPGVVLKNGMSGPMCLEMQGFSLLNESDEFQLGLDLDHVQGIPKTRELELTFDDTHTTSPRWREWTFAYTESRGEITLYEYQPDIAAGFHLDIARAICDVWWPVVERQRNSAIIVHDDSDPEWRTFKSLKEVVEWAMA